VIDLHCHILPGVDDGATDLTESEAALGRMYEQGIRGIVVTPHIQASILLRPGEAEAASLLLDEAWKSLLELGRDRHPDLSLHRGAELMLDHPNPDLKQSWLRLAGTRFVLVEFLGMLIPPRATDVLAALVRSDFVPVIAHPERYRNAGDDCRDALGWREVGARLQVNCGSLLGGYGPEACRRAWRLLEAASVDYLASDYHARGGYPVGECRRALQEEGANAQFDLLLCTNPARLLENLDPLDVPPTDPRLSPWKKLVKRSRFW
jgi:protein-tyrosine phosphatase